jgi:5S rRNA maturation endonuclease (ribonuclease M5)
MEKYPAIIVVEGKSDKDLIDSFMDADVVMTNGSEVSRETIDYLKKPRKNAM